MRYHVTALKNLESIMTKGLMPFKGERSLKFGEPVEAIFLFKDRISAEEAIMNWLGEEFPEEESICLLEVDTSAYQEINSIAEFELMVFSNIKPEFIKAINID